VFKIRWDYTAFMFNQKPKNFVQNLQFTCETPK
jgi:hypothetical protein